MPKLSSLRLLLLCSLLLAQLPVVFADSPPDADAKKRQELYDLADSIKPQEGVIHLRDDIATIQLTPDFRYLTPEDAEKVVHQIWGNPPDPRNLGMIVPRGFSPFTHGNWAVYITYSDDGYVKDEDAASTDYDKLLKQMQDGSAEVNKEREKAGYPAVTIVGWAVPPHYDASTHKLYWARDLKFSGREGRSDTLNYDVRILGRHGYLVLNAIAGMEQLKQIQAASPKVLAMVNFNEGNRYADFVPSTDKVATYGIAALVLGGIAAKAGFFKLLLVGILAAKKFILMGIAACWAFFKKVFKRKPKAEALAAAPVEPPPTPPVA